MLVTFLPNVTRLLMYYTFPEESASSQQTVTKKTSCFLSFINAHAGNGKSCIKLLHELHIISLMDMSS